MFKNVTGQKIRFFAFDYTTGAPKTGDSANLTAYVSKDRGTLTALGDTSATEVSSTNAPGVYEFDLTQAETAADTLDFTAKSATSNVSLVGTLNLQTAPNRFGILGIDTGGSTLIQSALKQGVALPNFPFTMRDTTGAPLTGSTVTVSRAIDSATTFTSIGSATEKANGGYHISLGTGDTAGRTVLLRMSGSGGSGTPADNMVTLVFEP